MLTAASRLTPGAPGYAVELVAVGGGKIVTAGGIELVARRAARNVRGAIDTVLVPGGVGTGDGGRAVVPHLVRLAKRARRVVGVCSGAFILGEAGLLEGRRAATHWAVCDLLAQRHPGCQVDADAIYVRDGRVWTSAGVTAGMDLALALVEADHGAELALEVARWLVLYLRRPGGQSQFSAPLVPVSPQPSMSSGSPP